MKALAVVVAALIAGALGGYFASGLGDSDADDAETPEIIETGLAEVVRTDLVQTQVLAGELRFSQPGSLLSQRAGTITAVPEEGTVLAIGDVAYEIDGVAVEILRGERPAWRAFVAGMESGADILQLEENLAELGYTIEAVDETFDDDTIAAIEAWQSDRGDPITGFVALGRVAFVDHDFRVGETLSVPGSAVMLGTPVYRTSSLDQEVVIELDPRDLDLISLGAPVTVTLPSGEEIPGEIVEVDKVVRRLGLEPDGPEVIDVVVGVDATGIDLERAPVDVEVESDRASSVLAVPVRALLTLSDGGYAIEVMEDSESRLIGVTIGDFAAGLVEIEGPVSEGDLVVVPVG